MNKIEATKPRITLWEIVMLCLSIYVLGALFLDTVLPLSPENSSLLNHIDNFICFLFLGDFLFKLMTVKKKGNYLKWGWIDLVSSIPNLESLRWGRGIRVIRIFRILRGIRSTKLILKVLFANRAKGTFVSVSLVSFFLMIFASIAILNFETSNESNIKSASDALWWSFVTITTVGYGDFYPTTLFGRLVAAALMIAGVGLFGTFTAYVATAFLQNTNDQENKSEGTILLELKAIGTKLDSLKGQLDNQSRE